jgi:K+-transporting ATPase KdpF subunit
MSKLSIESVTRQAFRPGFERRQIHTAFLPAPTQHLRFSARSDHGSVVYRPDSPVGGADLGWRGAVRAPAGAAMSALYWIALLLTLGLFGYLLYAMLKAERF